MNSKHLVLKELKYCRYSLSNITILELFEIINYPEYDFHMIVFEEESGLKRFPLKKINSIEELYEFLSNKSINLEISNMGSDNYNILEASYIDSYYIKKRPYTI